MSRLRRHATPQTLICRACAVPFVWDGRSARKPHYCTRRVCPTTPRADGRPHYAMVPCGICKPQRDGARVPTGRAA